MDQTKQKIQKINDKGLIDIYNENKNFEDIMNNLTNFLKLLNIFRNTIAEIKFGGKIIDNHERLMSLIEDLKKGSLEIKDINNKVDSTLTFFNKTLPKMKKDKAKQIDEYIGLEKFENILKVTEWIINNKEMQDVLISGSEKIFNDYAKFLDVNYDLDEIINGATNYLDEDSEGKKVLISELIRLWMKQCNNGFAKKELSFLEKVSDILKSKNASFLQIILNIFDEYKNRILDIIDGWGNSILMLFKSEPSKKIVPDPELNFFDNQFNEKYKKLNEKYKKFEQDLTNLFYNKNQQIIENNFIKDFIDRMVIVQKDSLVKATIETKIDEKVEEQIKEFKRTYPNTSSDEIRLNKKQFEIVARKDVILDILKENGDFKRNSEADIETAKESYRMSMKKEISIQLLSVNSSEKSDDKVKINAEGGIDKNYFLDKDLGKALNDLTEAFEIARKIFEDCRVKHTLGDEKQDYYQYVYIKLRRALRKTEDKLPGMTNILILSCLSCIPEVCQKLIREPLPNIENTNAKISVVLSYVPSYIASNLSLDYLISWLIQPNPLPVILPEDSLNLLRSTYDNMPKQPVFDLLQSLDYNFDILLNIFSKDSNEQPKIVLSEFIKNFLKKIDEFNNNKTHILEIGTPQKNETKEEIEKLRVEKAKKEIIATKLDFKDIQESIKLLLNRQYISISPTLLPIISQKENISKKYILNEIHLLKTMLDSLAKKETKETKEDIKQIRTSIENLLHETLQQLDKTVTTNKGKKMMEIGQKEYEINQLTQKKINQEKIKTHSRLRYYLWDTMGIPIEDVKSIQEQILKLDHEETHMERNIENMEIDYEEIKEEADQLLLDIKRQETMPQIIQKNNQENISNDFMRIEPTSIQEVDWKNIIKVLIANDYIDLETGAFNKNCPKLKIKLHNVILTPEADALIGVLKEKGLVDFDLTKGNMQEKINGKFFSELRQKNVEYYKQTELLEIVNLYHSDDLIRLFENKVSQETKYEIKETQFLRNHPDKKIELIDIVYILNQNGYINEKGDINTTKCPLKITIDKDRLTQEASAVIEVLVENAGQKVTFVGYKESVARTVIPPVNTLTATAVQLPTTTPVTPVTPVDKIAATAVRLSVAAHLLKAMPQLIAADTARFVTTTLQ